MPIRRLELTDFRNYRSRVLEPGDELTILAGSNAAGKTNVIEAVELVTAARSFRSPRWEELVRWGSERARIAMTAEEDGRPLDVVLEVEGDGRRSYRVNGQQKRRVSDVAGILPSVTFTPEDLELVKGAAERRRAALDDLGEQLSRAYAVVRRDYGRVVRQRNALLKDATCRPADLAPWDEQLVTLGAKLTAHRTRLYRRVREHVTGLYADLSEGERLEVAYVDKAGLGAERWMDDVPAETVEATLRQALAARAADERVRQVSLVGPHRDDLVFTIEDKDARTFGSQGQQRTIALAWKLAEVRVVEDVSDREPVLLLDDVMSELDERRRHALTDLVRRHVQTLVTTTNLGYFDEELLRRATIVELAR